MVWGESQRLRRQEREHSKGVSVWVMKLEIGFLWISMLPPTPSRGILDL